MQKKIFLLYTLWFNTQAQITFNKTYNNGIDGDFNVIELQDGYLTASIAGQPIYPCYIFLFKTDFNGDTVWQKKYGDSSEYYGLYSLLKTNDGNFVAGGSLYNFISNQNLCYLMKFDANGDTIWTRKITPPNGFRYFGEYITQASDKGFLISGQIDDTSNTDGDALILKTDSNGNYLWHKTFGGPNYDLVYSSVELPDKSFLTVGWTRSFGFGSNTNHDVYLIKTDSLGNFKWLKTYGTTMDEQGIGITSLSDGNYLLAGIAQVAITYPKKAYLVKIDTAGTIIWEKKIGNTDIAVFWWARETADHNIIAAGNKTNSVTQVEEGWITLLDSSGNQLWERSFGMNNDQAYFRDVKQTSDGGYICAGFVFTGASGNQDAWLVKLDSLGCDSDSCATYFTGINEPIKNKNNIAVYPNPATNVIFVKLLNNHFEETFAASIYNTLGEEVLKRKMINSEYAQPLFINSLVKGFYLLRIETERTVESIKFFKE